MMRVLRQVPLILAKDLLIEWRARSRVLALSAFVFTLLLLFAFAAGANAVALRGQAAASLWMSLFLASTLLLSQSFQTEVEGGALERLLMAPVSPAALYYGKALANCVQLFGLGIVGVIPMVALFDSPLEGPFYEFAGLLALGAAGVAAPGTFYAAMTARMQSKQLLLPLLLFPLLVPCLLAAVKATALWMTGDVMDEVGSWAALLLCFDLLYWSLCGALFSKMLED
jgi:heme exporter protein B